MSSRTFPTPKCPKCRKPMRNVRNVYDSPMFLDATPTPHGNYVMRTDMLGWPYCDLARESDGPEVPRFTDHGVTCAVRIRPVRRKR
jgi:hypothetical protein